MTEVKREIFGMTVKMQDAGTYPDLDTGQQKEKKEGLSIVIGGNYLKITALQLAGIICLDKDAEFREELTKRVVAEKFVQHTLLDKIN